MDSLAEYEAWLAKWTAYCQNKALREATRFTPTDEPTQVGAAVCMYAQTESGEVMSAMRIWTPAEARGLMESGILGDIMWEERAAYMRIMQASAERTKDPIRRLTYAMYSPLDLLMQG